MIRCGLMSFESQSHVFMVATGQDFGNGVRTSQSQMQWKNPLPWRFLEENTFEPASLGQFHERQSRG